MREVTGADETMENNNNDAGVVVVAGDPVDRVVPIQVEDNNHRVNLTNELVEMEDSSSAKAVSVNRSSAISVQANTALETLNEAAAACCSSTASSGVTLETLSEDGVVPTNAHGANGGQHTHAIHHHPLLTPTSPRSVTTTSMSASGKLNFC